MFSTNNSLYKNISNDILLTTFSKLTIPFDEKWQRIGINLSGGADSALLTYLLCTIIQRNNLDTKVDVITYQRCWETRRRGWRPCQLTKLSLHFLHRLQQMIHQKEVCICKI